jgi:hypothetical protein
LAEAALEHPAHHLHLIAGRILFLVTPPMLLRLLEAAGVGLALLRLQQVVLEVVEAELIRQQRQGLVVLATHQ